MGVLSFPFSGKIPISPPSLKDRLADVGYPELAGLSFMGYFECIIPLSQVTVSVGNLLVSLTKLSCRGQAAFASAFKILSGF